VTTYSLFPSTNGPATPVSYTGPFLAGVVFEVSQGGMWLNGFRWWVCGTGQSTSAQKFALWQVTGINSGVLVANSTVTSGTLTAGQWNLVTLPAPIPLAIGTSYCACTGFSNSFPDSDTSGAGTGITDSYGTGGGHSAGIVNGPLTAFSDTTGTNKDPYGSNQGLFSASLGTDPAVHMPNAQSNSGNFWMDVQVDTATPGTYSGSYRIWPTKVDANAATVPDLNVDYVVATEFHLSQRCTLNRIWYYSPSGTAQLATSADIWSITGANSGSIVAGTNSPSWSGAAGSGWISTSFAGVTLPAGSYKASVFNNASVPDQWSAKDASTNFWDTGAGGNGITWGPLTAPGLSSASNAYNFVGANGGSTPPFTDGTILPGQCTFAQSGTNIYPYLYVTGLAQNYWVDVEVTPVTAPNVPPYTASMSSM
jgi:hypothetical protein